jgi:signal transduction histidine kinase
MQLTSGPDPSRIIEVLVRAAESLTSTRGTTEIMRLLIESALELVGGEAGTWGTHDGDRMLFTEYFRRGRWETIDCVFVKGGPGVPGYVMEHRRGYICNDTSNDPVPRRDLVELLGFRDLIDLPLVNRHGELLGAFELHNKTGGAKWGEADYELLRGLASIAVAALESDHARERAERQAARDQLTANVAVVLASSLEVEPVLRKLAEVAVQRFSDWCVVHRIADDGWLEPIAITHADPSHAPVAARLHRRLAPMLESGVGIHAPAERRGLLYRDIDDALLQRAARDADHLAAIRDMRSKSLVTAPVLVADKPLGAISMHRCRRNFEDEDLATLEVLAGRVGAMLHQAILHERTGSLVQRLERLQNVTLELAGARTVAEVARTIVENGRVAVDALACVLWQEQGDQVLHLLDAAGVPAEHLEVWRVIPPDSSAPGVQIVATGIAQWIETEQDWREQLPAVYELWRARTAVTAYAGLPIGNIRGKRALLVFNFPLGHRFGVEDRSYLLTFARQCQQALERAQLFATEAQARERAEAASRAKDEFLAMLGHELRNPLAPIATAIELLKRGGRIAGSRELAILERQTQHLAKLVDDLLDVSRITRGMLELKRQLFDLRDAIANAVETASPLLEQRRHELNVEVARGLLVDGDATRLAQVVANLLTNAAKYTPNGGRIDVRAAREGQRVVVRVRDTGTGIDPALLPHVFDLFTQGARGIDRKEGGLGIGLTLVKRLTELHGGIVRAHSEGHGRGSELVVDLPSAFSATLDVALAQGSPAIPAGTLRRVLVVDDNCDAADTLADLLRCAGHEVVVAYDGPRALAIAEQFTPEVAIVDIGLPVIDGYEVAARLQTVVRDRRLRLLALTGYGQEHDRARSRIAGFSAHLVKPVSLEVLYRHLDDGE